MRGQTLTYRGKERRINVLINTQIFLIGQVRPCFLSSILSWIAELASCQYGEYKRWSLGTYQI